MGMGIAMGMAMEVLARRGGGIRWMIGVGSGRMGRRGGMMLLGDMSMGGMWRGDLVVAKRVWVSWLEDGTDVYSRAEQGREVVVDDEENAFRRLSIVQPK